MPIIHQMESLSASIRQLEGERDQVLHQLRSEQEDRQAVISKLEHLQQELATQSMLDYSSFNHMHNYCLFMTTSMQ